jgi:hypothetical protein
VLNFTLVLLFVLLLGVAVWAIVRGNRERPAARAGMTPQALDALAQPYRGLMAEALEIERDVYRQLGTAPPPLKRRLNEVAVRISRLMEAALPQARQGTMLTGYLLRLNQDEPQYAETKEAASAIERELEHFVASLRSLRGKVYGLLTGAAQLEPGVPLKTELEDALFELSALEAAFKELGGEEWPLKGP